MALILKVGIGIVAAVLVLGGVAFCVAGILGDAAPLWNWLARKLGLQGEGKPTIQFVGKTATVVSCQENGLRVDFDGTSWRAESLDDPEGFRVGDSVLIESVSGSTLIVRKSV